MHKPKLLTSCARNDVAVGRFVGFLATLLLLAWVFALAERVAPYSPRGLPWSTVRGETLVQMSLSLMFALALAAVETSLFVWLRRRVPEFARGYRAGCLFILGFFALFVLLVFFDYLLDK